MMVNSVTRKTDILIADGGTSSNKYKKAVSMNEKNIEREIKAGNMVESQIGEYQEGSLTATGELVLITDSINLIPILDKIYG